MGARGTKAKPASIHLLNGNPSQLPIGKLQEEADAVDVRAPAMPSYLGTTAKREWARLVRVLKKYGLITLLDKAALEAYCVSYGRWVDAEREIDKVGINGLIQTYESGAQAVSPLVTIASKYHAQMKGYLAEFGLSPSARRGLDIRRQDDGDKAVDDDESSPDRFFD